MERPAKRPRHLTNPLDSVYGANYNNQHAYFEVPGNGGNGIEEPEPEPEVDEQIYDPDQDLQQKRARADFKLKSTFEAIFEKYGRDFGGIGDEIDMRTGQIAVNNGHVLSMRHEADAGEIQSQDSEELDDMSGSEEEDLEDEEDELDQDNQVDDEEDEPGEEAEDEEDYDDEDHPSDEEMDEDDMILRGFAQASQHIIQSRQPYEHRPPKDRFAGPDPNHPPVVRSSLPKSILPSRSEILAQFGPQLGPEIAKYVSERAAPKDGIESAWRVPDIGSSRQVPSIESAWRVPDIGSFRRIPNVEPAWRIPDIERDLPPTLGRRPLINSMVVQLGPEIERSPSPENAPSIWAVTTGNTSRRRASRKRFESHEDRLLLDFVSDAKRRGLNLGKISTWKLMEAMHPGRDAKSWKQRYSSQFTYLRQSPHEEADLSTSEASSSTAHLPNQRLNYDRTFAEPPPLPARPIDSQRPARARKPALRDGVVSWSEAIAAIASIDPVGNAGLLDDVYSMGHELPVSSMFPNRRHSLNDSTPRRRVERDHRYQARPEPGIDSLSDAEDELALNDSAYGTEEHPAEKAPCPHADCKSFPTTLYRLDRADDEELSPMCSHLLYEHHITPFPCGEANCERKGPRGYFMQRDLVGHVRDAHPYATALHRLRGRVDPELLDQSHRPDHPRQSIELGPNIFPGKEPRDSDFMATGSSTRRPHSGYEPDPHRTPRAGVKAASASPSSMHVHASPGKTNNIPVNHREVSSDSDFQILDGNPFLEVETVRKEKATDLAVTRNLDRCDNVPASGSSFAPAVPESQSGTTSAMSRNLNGEQTISSHPIDLSRRIQDTATAPTVSQSTLRPSLPTTLPTPQRSHADMTLSRPQTGQASRIAGNVRPTWHLEQGADRSYEFSDDEDGIRPVVRRQHPQPSPPQNPVSLPQSFFDAPMKVESPRIPAPAKPYVALAKKLPSASNQFFVTPSSKPKPRKSAIHDVLASEEVDELSFGENGFILLSARPRSNNLPNLDLQAQVKQEENEIRPPTAVSSKKRLFRSIERDEDVDELAEDNPVMSTPRRSGPVARADPEVTTLEKHGVPRSRYILKPKPRKRLSDGVGHQPSSSLTSFQTPRRHQQLPDRTGTPLLNLVQSKAEIPSTSELGSTPTSRPAQREAVWTNSRFAVLVTPHKSMANRTVKVEEESDNVITPGGTLRRCGQDGFVCGRAFCFQCDAMVE